MRSTAALCLVTCFIAAGCGGSSSAQEGPHAPTLEALWHAPGEDVAIVPGTADFGPGNVRLTFLVIDGQGRVVTRPSAKVWLARSLKAKPFIETTARSEPIGIEGGESADVGAIFVTELDLEQPGTYWVLAEPVGGRKIQAVGNVVVRDKPVAPAVGDPAPPTDTPTLANATMKELTTSRVPDRELYRSSVKDALAAKVPFVVVFATPAYCTSRTCGPVVDVVSTVRKRHAGSKDPLHPRRGLPGQRPDEGREPVVQGVAPALRAVDVPRRARRQGARAVRGARSRCASSTPP